MKKIALSEICGIEVLSRANVRKVYDCVEQGAEEIDMSDVTFISRSVADELCTMVEQHPTVRLTGMTEEVATMLSIVGKGRSAKRSFRPKFRVRQTYHCRTMDDLRTALLSFGN